MDLELDRFASFVASTPDPFDLDLLNQYDRSLYDSFCANPTMFLSHLLSKTPLISRLNIFDSIVYENSHLMNFSFKGSVRKLLVNELSFLDLKKFVSLRGVVISCSSVVPKLLVSVYSSKDFNLFQKSHSKLKADFVFNAECSKGSEESSRDVVECSQSFFVGDCYEVSGFDTSHMRHPHNNGSNDSQKGNYTHNNGNHDINNGYYDSKSDYGNHDNNNGYSNMDNGVYDSNTNHDRNHGNHDRNNGNSGTEIAPNLSKDFYNTFQSSSTPSRNLKYLTDVSISMSKGKFYEKKTKITTNELTLFAATSHLLSDSNNAKTLSPSTLKHQKSLSLYVDTQTVVLQQFLEDMSPGQLPKSVELTLFNTFCNTLSPGDVVEVLGVYKPVVFVDYFKVSFVCFSIFKLNDSVVSSGAFCSNILPVVGVLRKFPLLRFLLMNDREKFLLEFNRAVMAAEVLLKREMDGFDSKKRPLSFFEKSIYTNVDLRIEPLCDISVNTLQSNDCGGNHSTCDNHNSKNISNIHDNIPNLQDNIRNSLANSSNNIPNLQDNIHNSSNIQNNSNNRSNIEGSNTEGSNDVLVNTAHSSNISNDTENHSILSNSEEHLPDVIEGIHLDPKSLLRTMNNFDHNPLCLSDSDYELLIFYNEISSNLLSNLGKFIAPSIYGHDMLKMAIVLQLASNGANRHPSFDYNISSNVLKSDNTFLPENRDCHISNDKLTNHGNAIDNTSNNHLNNVNSTTNNDLDTINNTSDNQLNSESNQLNNESNHLNNEINQLNNGSTHLYSNSNQLNNESNHLYSNHSNNKSNLNNESNQLNSNHFYSNSNQLNSNTLNNEITANNYNNALFNDTAKCQSNHKRLKVRVQTRQTINILVVGDPSTAKSQILRHISSTFNFRATSGRGVSGVGLTALVKSDSGRKEIIGGAMVLSDNQTLIIDEFDKIQKKDQSKLHEAMEQQQVSIAKSGLSVSLKARCCVLAACNPLYSVVGLNNKSKRVCDMVSNRLVSFLDVEESLLTRFDLVFCVKDEVNADLDMRIAQKVLLNHTNSDSSILSIENGGHTLEANLENVSNKSTNESNEHQMYDSAERPMDNSNKSGSNYPSNCDPVSIPIKDLAYPLNYDPNNPSNCDPDSIPVKDLAYPTKSTNQINDSFIQRNTETFKRYIKAAQQIPHPILTKQAQKAITTKYTQMRTNTNLNQHITPRTLETLIRLSTSHAKLRLSLLITKTDVDAVYEILMHTLNKQQHELDLKTANTDSLSQKSDYNKVCDLLFVLKEHQQESFVCLPDLVKMLGMSEQVVHDVLVSMDADDVILYSNKTVTFI